MNRITVNDSPDILDANAASFEERRRELAAISAKQCGHVIKQQFHMMLHMKHAYEAMDWLIATRPNAARVFNWMLYNMQYCNYMECSQSDIAEALNLSRVTVNRTLKFLEQHNFICRDANSGSRTYTYYVNRDIAWKGNRTTSNQAKCKCYGEPILDKDLSNG